MIQSRAKFRDFLCQNLVPIVPKIDTKKITKLTKNDKKTRYYGVFVVGLSGLGELV